MNNIECMTNKPIAFDSPDHICPVGAKNDNTSNLNFVKSVEKHFQRKINYLDCGCAGGGFVTDFHNNGHLSVGLEGSNYNLKHGQFNWPQFGNKILFTCDITEPFELQNNKNPLEFDLITAWEVMEHLAIESIHKFLENVLAHLKDDGLFVCSINMSEDKRILSDGTEIKLHQTVENEQTWRKKILKDYNVGPYPFDSLGRITPNSFYISIKK